MPFDLQPVLEGRLLKLRPLRLKDFSALYDVTADPLIWEQHPASDRYKEEVFQEFFREAMDSGGAPIALDSKSGEIIGSSRFHGYDDQASEDRNRWTFLARSYWGGIYNREMKQLIPSLSTPLTSWLARKIFARRKRWKRLGPFARDSGAMAAAG